IIIGVLFTAAVYLILSKSLLRIIFGTALISHGAHLFLLTMGGLGATYPPVIADGEKDEVDPLTKSLILTAIVISLDVIEYIFVLAYETYSKHQTDKMDYIREIHK